MSVRNFWTVRNRLDVQQADFFAQTSGSSSVISMTTMSTNMSASTAAGAGYAPLQQINFQAMDEYRFGNGIQLGDAIDAADAFLRSGSSPAGTAGLWFQQCSESNSCGSGFACIGGECVPDFDAINGAGAGSDCGGFESGKPCTGGAAGGSSGECLTTTAGDCSKNGGQPDVCCGRGRCCSFSGAGVVCYCGSCPESQCSVTCDKYYQANGENKAGCSEKNCSECAECEGGICVSKPNRACYCEGSQACSSCTECTEAGFCDAPRDVNGFIDSNACLGCVECSRCGKSNTACAGVGADAESIANAVARCIRGIGGPGPCPDETPESCKGNCTTITVQGGGAAPSCPEGFNCSVSGSGTAGGTDFTLYEQCDPSELPESCKRPTCSCHDDCGDCGLCTGGGVCVYNSQCIPS